jgi:hypothetical protein
VNIILPSIAVTTGSTMFVNVVVVNDCARKLMKADVTQKLLSDGLVL